MKLTSDQLEALIVQAVDGTLSDLDRPALDERLAVDAEARLLLDQHRQLSQLLAAMPGPVGVDFNALSSRISAQIDQEVAYDARSMRMPMVWTRRLAIAAAVAIVAAIGWRAIPTASPDNLGPIAERPSNVEPNVAPAQNEMILVTGPSIEQAPQAAQIDIAVGPTPAMAERGMTYGLADDALASPAPRVVIGAAEQPAAPPSGDGRLY